MQKSKIIGMVISLLLVSMLLILSSCATSNYSADIRKEQVLTDQELSDIALWKSNKEALFVQKHLEDSEDTTFRAYNTWIASYEGFRIASLLELDEIFTTEQLKDFIKALFEDMPNNVETGDIVKSIVVKNWYFEGDPLVINVTRAFTAEKIPTVVYMFNTWDDVNSFKLKMIKKAGIAFDYPRLKTADGKYQKEFLYSYIMTWIENGCISASNSFGKGLPDFSTMLNNIDKISLTDDWLRDGDLSNDEEAYNVLMSIIEQEDLKPFERVFANMQLFMYHLFHAEPEKAQAVIDKLKASGILEDKDVSETEIGKLAKTDMQKILDIAKLLSVKIADEKL